MKLVKPSVEIKNQETGLDGIYKQIEWAGRHCYKSLDKITEDSAKKFVDMLANNKHGAMLEHGTVYLMIHTVDPKDWDKKVARHRLITIDDAREDIRTNPTYNSAGEENWWAKEAYHIACKTAIKYADNPYSKVKIVTTKHELNTKGGIIITPTDRLPRVTKTPDKMISVFNTVLITTNLRILVENNWLDDLQYICEPTEYHAKRVTVKFTIDNGIMREFTRHRTMSFACESTRYCNYSKSKFDSNVTYIIPSWIALDEQTINEPLRTTDINAYFLNGLLKAEDYYITLLQEGWKPQQARAVLPLATKCDLIMTGFIDDWKHFLSLRSSDYGATGAHPDASYIANKLYAKLREENYLS